MPENRKLEGFYDHGNLCGLLNHQRAMSEPIKILVIEDDDDIREYIRRILEKEHYQPITAPSGEAGVALARQYAPDMIICDIVMEGIDGYEVLSQLSASESTRMIPFIFLSGRVGHHNLRKGMELGADDYLFKPFRAPDLVSAVKARLNKYQMIKSKFGTQREPEGGGGQSILVPYNNTSIAVPVAQIKYIAAENQYSHLFLGSERKLLVRRSLSQWEEILPRTHFVRIHRSTIVNLWHVDRIEKRSPASHQVYLHNVPMPLEVSRRYLKHMKAAATACHGVWSSLAAHSDPT